MGRHALIDLLLTAKEAETIEATGISCKERDYSEDDSAEETKPRKCCRCKKSASPAKKWYTLCMDMDSGDPWQVVRRPWDIALYKWVIAKYATAPDSNVVDKMKIVFSSYRWSGQSHALVALKLLTQTCPVVPALTDDPFGTMSARFCYDDEHFVRGREHLTTFETRVLEQLLTEAGVPELMMMFKMFKGRYKLADLVPCLESMLKHLLPYLPRRAEDLNNTPWCCSADCSLASWCKEDLFFQALVLHKDRVDPGNPYLYYL